MNRITVAFILLLSISLPAICQESDTLYHAQQRDTVLTVLQMDTIYHFGDEDLLLADTVLAKPLEPKSANRALMYALALPGLGQAYNGKYWKMPLVWGAMGAAGYAISYTTKLYKQSILDYIQIEDYDERYLEFYRRNMELSYIAMIAVYGLQILDAYVDAYLYSWDVNDNLSLRIAPALQPMMAPTSLTGYSGGITCSLKIRGR
jgi:Family of unknown function (DUF5683)